MDTLILGCTHYPLLEEVISDYMGPDVTLIDSGAEAANLASTQFNPNDGPGGTRYYVSDDPAGFDRLAGLFLQGGRRDQRRTRRYFQVLIRSI